MKHWLLAPLLATLIGLPLPAVAGEPPIEHYNVAFDVAPTGRQIVFSAADGDLYRLNLSTFKVSRLTQTKQEESVPAFSPDGKYIVYSASRPGVSGAHIFIRSLDGKTVRQLTRDSKVSDASPRFSPDGKCIVFVRGYLLRPYSMGGSTWDDFDLCVMNRNGSHLRRVTRQQYYGISGAFFLRDGKTIVYAADKGGGDLVTKLFAIEASRYSSPRTLTPEWRRKITPPNDFGTIASDPSLSFDGKQIIFVSDRNGAYAYDLFLMPVRRGKPSPLRITRVSGYNQNPRFSPDGKSVYFLAGTESNGQGRAIFSLWRIGTDGKKPAQVVDSTLFTTPSAWASKHKHNN